MNTENITKKEREKNDKIIPTKEEVINRYAERFDCNPSWDSEESMIVGIKDARDEMRNERNKQNGIVKTHVDQRKEIQAKIKETLDEADRLKQRRTELNKSVSEMKKERKDATMQMKEIRKTLFDANDKERNGETVSEDEITELRELLEECEKSQEELHIFVTNIASEAQEAHDKMKKLENDVRELREAHSNEHRNVEKYRRVADEFHHDFLLFHRWLSSFEKVKIKPQSSIEAAEFNLEQIISDEELTAKDLKRIKKAIKRVCKEGGSDDLIRKAELKMDELYLSMKEEKLREIDNNTLSHNELNDALRNKIETICKEYYEFQCQIQEDLIIDSIEFEWNDIEIIIKVQGDETTPGKCIGKKGTRIRRLHKLIQEEIGKSPKIKIQSWE